MTATLAPPAAPARLVPLEDLHDVGAWLRTLSPGAVCGHAHDPSFCPLARYLVDRNALDGRSAPGGQPMVSVGLRHYRVGTYEAELPHWARLFVSGADRVPARRAAALGPGITAAEALKVLEGVGALEERHRAQPRHGIWGRRS